MPHRGGSFRSQLAAESSSCIFALAPLVPWTIRNFRTLHHFQPLAPRYANDADELVPRGFNRWVKTWIVDYVSVEEIYWNVPGDKIDPQKLPSRAIDERGGKGRDAGRHRGLQRGAGHDAGTGCALRPT